MRIKHPSERIWRLRLSIAVLIVLIGLDIALFALNGQWAEKTFTALIFQYFNFAWQWLARLVVNFYQLAAPFLFWLIRLLPKLIMAYGLFYLLRGPRFYELEWNEEILEFKKSWTPWGLKSATAQIIETPAIKAVHLQHKLFQKVLYIELNLPKGSTQTLFINCIPNKDARRLVQKINGFTAKKHQVYRKQKPPAAKEPAFMSLSNYSKVL